MSDHRVFGRLIAPGALYGAMAVSATLAEGSDAVIVEDFQMQSALVFPDEDAEDGDSAEAGRRVQVLLRRRRGRRGAPGPHPQPRRWLRTGGRSTRKGRISRQGSAGQSQAAPPLDIEGLTAALTPVDLAAYYRAKAAVGIDLGPSFRTVEALWARQGEAIAEVALPAGVERNPFDVHPLVLDGCFQVFGAARNPDGGEEGITYLPFAWERLWLARTGLPERLFCHVTVKEGRPGDGGWTLRAVDVPEVHAADLQSLRPEMERSSGSWPASP